MAQKGMRGFNVNTLGKVKNDIILINRVVELADLRNLQVRIALFHKISNENVFHSMLGNAFLASLVKDNFYGRPDASAMVIHDLDALGRILDYLKHSPDPQNVEKIKKYQFQCSWIQKFAAGYLENCRQKTKQEAIKPAAGSKKLPVAKRPAKESAEIADLKKIRRLVRLGNAGEPFPYDAADALMEKHKDEEIFHSWIGKFFQEAVHARTTAVKKKGRMKKILGVLGLACCQISLVFLFWGLHLKEQEKVDKYLTQFLQDKKSMAAVQKTGTEMDFGTEQGNDSLRASGENEQSQMLEKYQKLYEENHDMAGWLEIEGTGISYPVMQKPTQEDFYLTHGFLGEESHDGLLFVDGEASLSPPDDNVVVYGHNMKSGNIFGTLMFYKDYSFFLNNPVFRFDTLYEERSYRIVAVFVADTSSEDGFCYYTCRDLSDREVFRQCTDYIKENQLYDTGERLEYGDKVVMLSTCESASRAHRLVVVGKQM